MFVTAWQAVTALRLLLLRESNPTAWAAVQEMESHTEQRRADTEHWRECQQNIVHYLTVVCGLPYTEDEIQHVIGVIEVEGRKMT